MQFKQQFYKHLGDNIKRARKERKMTQEAFGNLVGSNRTTIVNIERGQQQVPVHLLLELATALSVPAFDLLPKVTHLQDRPAAERNWIEQGLRAASKGLASPDFILKEDNLTQKKETV